ncbi:MAG: hypothetical protein HOH04_14060 [Rhodospirillaceae bacterium]|jgi:hypothetical protein|nr:hypothetical protein [Rhodospirillaceae bacterium]
MRLRLIVLSLAFLILVSGSAQLAQAAETVNLISGEMKGGYYERRGKTFSGVYPDLFREAAGQSNVSVDFSLVPWARAVATSKRSDNVLIFPLARKPDREKQFTWLVPLVSETVCFSSAGTPVNSIDEARARKRVLGWLGSSTFEYLQAQNFKNLIKVTNTAKIIRILNADKDALFYYYCDQMQSFVDPGKEQIRLNVGKPVYAEESWLAGGLKLKLTDEISRFAKTLKTLGKEGMLDRAIEKLK